MTNNSRDGLELIDLIEYACEYEDQDFSDVFDQKTLEKTGQCPSSSTALGALGLTMDTKKPPRRSSRRLQQLVTIRENNNHTITARGDRKREGDQLDLPVTRVEVLDFGSEDVANFASKASRKKPRVEGKGGIERTSPNKSGKKTDKKTDLSIVHSALPMNYQKVKHEMCSQPDYVAYGHSIFMAMNGGNTSLLNKFMDEFCAESCILSTPSRYLQNNKKSNNDNIQCSVAANKTSGDLNQMLRFQGREKIKLFWCGLIEKVPDGLFKVKGVLKLPRDPDDVRQNTITVVYQFVFSGRLLLDNLSVSSPTSNPGNMIFRVGRTGLIQSISFVFD